MPKETIVIMHFYDRETKYLSKVRLTDNQRTTPIPRSAEYLSVENVTWGKL